MDWGYLAQVGKEGFRERIWTHFDNTQLSPTVGTAINANPTIFASAEAMIVIGNRGSRSGDGKNVMVIPVCIDLITTVRGTAGTWAAIGLAMDNSTVYTSGGVTLAARYLFKDTRSGWAPRTEYAQIQFGDLTITGTTKHVVNGWFPWSGGVTPFAVGDVFRFNFGANSGGSFARAVTSDAGLANQVEIALPPVCIAPGCSLILHPLITAMSAAASFNVVVTVVELGHPREVT